MKRIYLDHAATTPIDPRVARAMKPFWSSKFGNPGGLYEEGRKAKEAVDAAREFIARSIGAKSDEIIFTSGGTESDNLAVFGVANGMPRPSSTPGVEGLQTPGVFPGRGHIITTKFEHHAVLTPCEQLAKEGFSAQGGPASGWDVTFLEVGEEGVVNPEDIKNALRSETVLVSIMYANNEIGTIQPIAEIGKIIKEFRTQKSETHAQIKQYPFFHTDACQAAGYLNINVNDLGIDLMTVNGSKIYGPKGSGILYKRSGVKIKPMVVGGGQEKRMRSGTENVAGIVGLAEALELAISEREKESERLTVLRDYFIREIIKKIPKVVLNGHPLKRLPNNVNVSILDIEGEALVLHMDSKGISFSTGSACTSESLDPSHVILALGKPYEFAHSSMRFTMGRATRKKDLDQVLKVLPKTVEWLRKVSPVCIDPKASSMSHPEAFAGEGLRVKAKGKSYK